MFQNSPLRHPVFSLFYSGCVCTALGYTMQGTLAAWLMATLSTSAVMVALVQTATAGPVLVLGLIAGFVADSMDRRRMILITQWVMLAAVLALSAMESTHHLTPAVLLSLTVLVGVGFAFYLPAQMASIQSMVTRAELPAASALNAVAFNAARAVGPAFAGALVIGLSAGSALLASAAFFMVTIAIVYRS
jgi:MFS family permease